MKTILELPLPPSVNGLFATNRKTGRRFKSAGYKAWIAEAGWMIQSQEDRHHRHDGKVSFTLLVKRPDNRRRDAGNLLKACEDLVVRHGILADDSQIEQSSVRWAESPGWEAKVLIEDISNEGDCP